MSHNKDNFITYKTAEGQECKGIAAGMKIAWRITLKFIIYNDDGVTYMTTVRNSVHIPDLPMILVSLQHWAQQTSDGTESASDGKNTILSFRWYRKTIMYSVQSNTPSSRSASGTLWNQYFVAMVEYGSPTSKTLFRSKHVGTDDEASSSEGASEGGANKRNGYDADKEILMYDQEGNNHPNNHNTVRTPIRATKDMITIMRVFGHMMTIRRDLPLNIPKPTC